MEIELTQLTRDAVASKMFTDLEIWKGLVWMSPSKFACVIGVWRRLLPLSRRGYISQLSHLTLEHLNVTVTGQHHFLVLPSWRGKGERGNPIKRVWAEQ